MNLLKENIVRMQFLYHRILEKMHINSTKTLVLAIVYEVLENYIYKDLVECTIYEGKWIILLSAKIKNTGGIYRLRKIISFLMIIIMLMITGCSNREVINHNYTYKGENEFWDAEYNVNAIGTFTEKDNKTSYESESSKVLTVTYKRDLSELSSVEHLEISYKSSVQAGSITEDYDNESPLEKTYAIKSSSTNGAIENKDEVIKVTINIDGNVQTIDLKNQ